MSAVVSVEWSQIDILLYDGTFHDVLGRVIIVLLVHRGVVIALLGVAGIVHPV